MIWQNCLYLDSVTVVWQNCLYVDSVPCASDLAELPEQVIWQNFLYVEERASDLEELPVCGKCCASGLAELPVYRGVCQ